MFGHLKDLLLEGAVLDRFIVWPVRRHWHRHGHYQLCDTVQKTPADAFIFSSFDSRLSTKLHSAAQSGRLQAAHHIDLIVYSTNLTAYPSLIPPSPPNISALPSLSVTQAVMWRGQSVAATKKIIKMKLRWALKAETAASLCLFTTRWQSDFISASYLIFTATDDYTLSYVSQFTCSWNLQIPVV